LALKNNKKADASMNVDAGTKKYYSNISGPLEKQKLICLDTSLHVNNIKSSFLVL
jgi:hypothetical protein